MPVLIILTVKAMLEMIRKGEYRRLASRILFAALLVGVSCLVARSIPSTLSRTATASSQEATLSLRSRSINHDPARIPSSVAENFRSPLSSMTDYGTELAQETPDTFSDDDYTDTI